MMKAMKKLCFLATIVALIALLIISASATDTWYALDGIVGGKLQFDPETGYVTGIERSVTSATIPSTVISVYTRAFAQSTNLTQIVVPDSAVLLGNSAFQDCSSLTDISIPDAVYAIGSGAFLNCNRLSSITLPTSLTALSTDLFIYCASLTHITIPPNVTAVGNSAFCRTGLETVKTIGWQAFNQCTSLKQVYFGGSQSQWSNVIIEEYNTALDGATFHYNSQTTPIPVTNTATLSDTKLQVNDTAVTPQAYLISDNNYIKLRDLATMLAGTAKEFEVTWNNELGTIEMQSSKSYTAVGGEMTTSGLSQAFPIENTAPIYLDGELVELTAYTINDNNYFKLRDVMKLFDVFVGYDNATSTATLDTGLSYTEE